MAFARCGCLNEMDAANTLPEYTQWTAATLNLSNKQLSICAPIVKASSYKINVKAGHSAKTIIIQQSSSHVYIIILL